MTRPRTYTEQELNRLSFEMKIHVAQQRIAWAREHGETPCEYWWEAYEPWMPCRQTSTRQSCGHFICHTHTLGHAMLNCVSASIATVGGVSNAAREFEEIMRTSEEKKDDTKTHD
jgi:hypothetical protein